ncbi:MAG: nuclear transport factor 2 family protein [Ilumatobacter sp.]
MSEIDDVHAINQAFYAAHEARDLDAMADVWDHSDRAVCVHPGWPILRGWDQVEGSWRGIFAGAGRSQFILTNQSTHVMGDMAWVTLEENLVDVGNTFAVAATNVFVRHAGEWKLIAHHGSSIHAVLG